MHFQGITDYYSNFHLFFYKFLLLYRVIIVFLKRSVNKNKVFQINGSTNHQYILIFPLCLSSMARYATLKIKIMLHKSQQGAVLFVSLALLIVMTLLGLSVVKLSIMSVHVAHNDETLMKSFNQAEVTLREGESELSSLAGVSTYTDFDDNNNHLYLSPIEQDSLEWTDGQSAGDDVAGRYVIVYQGMRPIGTESASLKSNGGISGSSLYLSNVVARGSVKETGARKVLRSTFATIKQP